MRRSLVWLDKRRIQDFAPNVDSQVLVKVLVGHTDPRRPHPQNEVDGHVPNSRPILLRDDRSDIGWGQFEFRWPQYFSLPSESGLCPPSNTV